MKTIEEAAREYIKIPPDRKIDSDERYFNVNIPKYDAFKDGIAFAEEWISVEDELPDFDNDKLIRGEQELYLVKMSVGSISCKTTYKVSFLINEYRWNGEFDWNCVTHWRPINRK